MPALLDGPILRLPGRDLADEAVDLARTAARAAAGMAATVNALAGSRADEFSREHRLTRAGGASTV
jgi:hypothetical protein